MMCRWTLVCRILSHHISYTTDCPGILAVHCHVRLYSACMASNPYSVLLHICPRSRRRLLRGFAFRCRCDRCEAAQDDTRDIPCPRCVPRTDDGKLPTEMATGAASPSGVLRLHAAAATTAACTSGQPGSLPTGQVGTSNNAGPGPAPPAFECSACGFVVPCNDSAALFNPLANTDAAAAGVRGPGRTQALNLDGMTDLEGALCDAVWQYWFYVTSYNEYEWGRVCGLVAAAGRWLGPCHYATTLARLVRVGTYTQNGGTCMGDGGTRMENTCMLRVHAQRAPHV